MHELKTLLANAGIEPPYVLVGHSIAGLHSRLYAHQYPQDVVGMVLIDPSHEEQGERFPAELMALQDEDIRLFNLCRFAAPFGIVRLLGVFNHTALPLDVRQVADMLSYQNRLCHSILLEIEEAEPNTEQMAGVDSLGDTPLLVLSRGRPPSLNDMPSGATAELVEQMELVWQELQKEHAARSSRGRQIIATESGHYIHIDQPQLVIEAVRQVVEQAR